MHCVRVCVAYMCNILVREQSHSQGWWVELDDKPRVVLRLESGLQQPKCICVYNCVIGNGLVLRHSAQ